MNEETDTTNEWVGGVCIHDDKVLLIHRINNTFDFYKEYFVFPGKKLQGDETLETALIRAFKDYSITVVLGDLLYSKEDDGDGKEDYYVCDYVLGEPALIASSVQAKEMTDEGQVCTPLWVDLSDIEDLIIYPESVKLSILENLTK